MAMKIKERRHIRLKNYDYSQKGYYFVTVCADNHKEHFGNIGNGQMFLNEHGTIAAAFWQEIPRHYRDVELDKWVIMPNHIHGIIAISDSSTDVGEAQCASPTIAATTVKSTTISQIIKSFKDMTVKNIRSKLADIYFSWQRSFYDHVIRDESSLNQIREYIVNNPKQWDIDVENSRNFHNNSSAYYNKIIGV